MKNFILITFILFQIPSKAWGLSANRKENEDYSSFMTHGKKRISPMGSAKYYTESLELPPVTNWSSVQKMQERFEKIRDERFMRDPKIPEFKRRISWLYPYDGCWTRAALFNRGAYQLLAPVPKKVFVFGNLSVETSNAPGNRVSWWFHVAPIVEVAQEKYVLDPSIEPSRPLALKEWLERMGAPSEMKIAICHTGTYAPTSNCTEATNGVEITALGEEKYYLNAERSLLNQLGRIPDDELGANPPWELFDAVPFR